MAEETCNRRESEGWEMFDALIHNDLTVSSMLEMTLIWNRDNHMQSFCRREKKKREEEKAAQSTEMKRKWEMREIKYEEKMKRNV